MLSSDHPIVLCDIINIHSLHILLEFDIYDSHVLKIQVPRLMMKGTPHMSCARIEMMEMAVLGTSLLMKD